MTGGRPRRDRQRIERAPGSRRARLTAAPGTGDEPAPDPTGADPDASREGPGPNDERMRRDVPPHY